MTDTDATPSKGELIERRIDRPIVTGLQAGTTLGGLRITNVVEVMEVSKLMALSRQAVPEHLRENPGMCLAICMQALEWGVSPWAAAQKSYVANDRLSYESQMVHAIIEARAPLKSRLRCRYSGEGEERRCTVYATFKGEEEPHEFTSETLAKLRPKRNEYGKVKGSPLWDTKPDLQLFYNASRDWVRAWCPDVLLGIYTPDELEEMPAGAAPGDDAMDVSPGLHDRLKQAAAAGGEEQGGFRDGVVEDGLRESAEQTQAPASGAPKARRTRRTKAQIEAEKAAGVGAQAASDQPAVAPTTSQETTPTQDSAPAQEAIPPNDSAKATTPEPEGDKPKGGKGAKPAEPKTPLEYAEHVKAWLPTLATEEAIEKRWASEIKTRNYAQVTSEERVPIRALVDERVEQVKPQKG